jgi:hypothetical protein
VKGAPFTIPEVPGSELENLIYYNQLHKGGHFAAWEQPQIFPEEVRAGQRPLRK